MSKHTPGPWAYENYGGTVYVFLDNEGGTPAICKLLSFDKDANARLIAAAPDLLEALENLLKVHEGEGGTQHHAGAMARAAIAKAKGIMLTSSPPQDDWLFLAMKHFQSVIAKAKGEAK